MSTQWCSSPKAVHTTASAPSIATRKYATTPAAAPIVRSHRARAQLSRGHLPAPAAGAAARLRHVHRTASNVSSRPDKVHKTLADLTKHLTSGPLLVQRRARARTRATQPRHDRDAPAGPGSAGGRRLDSLLDGRDRGRLFVRCRAALPSWGGDGVDGQVARYVEGLARWVRGNDGRCFEGQRYFGTVGLAVKENRWVYMLPRVDTLDSRSLSLSATSWTLSAARLPGCRFAEIPRCELTGT
ncbi:hypothetical protein B0T24DRAFT_610595 [Lasiosphaeria ovina]|uniref:Uncharacterized protein n=1 Tax=Lasiosphaeria ovina TaxID=92902 RepID=A0AAE0NDI4_9PEZI|nr:hypothetical protein B0T24DRAFT_610595 [Lasiosphaeria ovina]